jgi:hypothetical protein
MLWQQVHCVKELAKTLSHWQKHDVFFSKYTKQAPKKKI